MNPHPFHQDNRAAWDITAAKYEQSEPEDIELLRAGGTTLMQPEIDALGDLSDWCTCAVHLQCAAGADTLSLLTLGAQEVVGVDISPRMIASARRKTAALGAKALWYCCDVLAVPPELNGTADLVHTGRGALLWMMDLDAWARVVYRLLKPGGLLHIYEGHPLDFVWDTGASTYQFHPQRGDYFGQGLYGGEIWPKPFLEYQEGIHSADYPIHDRAWTLGQILNSVIRAGFTLQYFNEYPVPFWNQFPEIPPDLLRRLPHSFTLMAYRPET